MTSTLKLLICKNFSEEARRVLSDKHFADVELLVFPARCGRPPISPAEFDELAKAGAKNSSVQLFGSCCASELMNTPGSEKHCKVNYLQQCFHLTCSKSMVDELLKEGAYLLTPGWLACWPEKIKEMGFDRAMARDFFEQSVKKLVLLDTGISDDSYQQLKEFSEFVARPYHQIPVGLDFLQMMLGNTIEKWHANRLQAHLALSQKRVADYAMAMDFLGRLACLEIEQDPVATIKELFSMLFAPDKLEFISDTAHTAICEDHWESAKKNGFMLADSGDGFLLALHSHERFFGMLKIDRVMFPANLDNSLNLALSVAGVCGLALHNAAIAQDLKSEITEKARLIAELHQAIDEIKNLRGVIPICSYCKKIRNDEGAWDKLEDYLLEHSDAEFTHGMCPHCYEIEMKKMDDEE
ncbi:MAG: hypothetical protein CVV42_07325 [Candidatus Riflebacteria bacterium HGW-Riflebacteria-2]|jgi:hypothetical protein|nr:MAG: hypothetical protein CVV42_07325 [Candidatus Riflebacteria bacterium HGW-Riflebacteria-2]